MIDKRMGFIGCGNMGGAIIGGAIEAGALDPAKVAVYDVSPVAAERCAQWGVEFVGSVEQLADKSDMVLIAVKPQQLGDLIEQNGAALFDRGIISIVAGVAVETLRKMLPGTARQTARILRVMPNTPALVGAGAAAFCDNTDLTDDELAAATELFESVGTVETVPESLIDAVTGVSGSGPAYVALFIEAMADAGVQQGLTRATATKLAAQTCMGAAKLILDKGMQPAALKDMVSSPGGTTIAGVAALERDGFRAALFDAVEAATWRSAELG